MQPVFILACLCLLGIAAASGFLAVALGAFGAHALEVHGHRGARARFPENSLPAFEHALAVGVDAL